MGHIIFAMNVSLDGFITDSAGEIAFPAPGPDLFAHFTDFMRDTALALCGRRLYEAMSYWDSPDDVIGPDPAGLEFARLWRETPKVVFSTTLKEVGPNARLVEGDAPAIVRPIKDQTEGTIFVEGPNLAGQLAKAGLIDEFRLYFHPVVLGGGKPFFSERSPLDLRFLGKEILPQDVVMLRYGPAV